MLKLFELFGVTHLEHLVVNVVELLMNVSTAKCTARHRQHKRKKSVQQSIFPSDNRTRMDTTPFMQNIKIFYACLDSLLS
jgi:hypothetical protein